MRKMLEWYRKNRGISITGNGVVHIKASTLLRIDKVRKNIEGKNERN